MNYKLVLFIVLAFSVSVLAACGSNESAVVADEALDDSETIGDGNAPIPIDVDTLRGSIWTLRFGRGPAGNVVLVDGWPITITFKDETFGGTAACNGYGGTYSIDGSTITFDQIGSKEMGCKPDVQASEAAFLSALGPSGIDLQ